jgi:hypothetical protein
MEGTMAYRRWTRPTLLFSAAGLLGFVVHTDAQRNPVVDTKQSTPVTAVTSDTVSFAACNTNLLGTLTPLQAAAYANTFQAASDTKNAKDAKARRRVHFCPRHDACADLPAHG